MFYLYSSFLQKKNRDEEDGKKMKWLHNKNAVYNKWAAKRYAGCDDNASS